MSVKMEKILPPHLCHEREVGKSLKGKGIPFQSRFCAPTTFRVLSNPFSKARGLLRKVELFNLRLLEVAQLHLYEWTGVYIPIEPDKEVIETRGTGFRHHAGSEIMEQLVPVKIPLKMIGLIEADHLLYRLFGKGQIISPVDISITVFRDNTG